jgi:hypothetical protein
MAATGPDWRNRMARVARERFSVAACLDAHEALFSSLREQRATTLR